MSYITGPQELHLGRENHSRFGDFTLERLILELTGSCFCAVNELWTHFADFILELTIYS